MAEYSKIAKGHVTSVTGGGTPVINLPFQPLSVKWWNQTAYATPTNTWVYAGYWDVSMGQGGGLVEKFGAGPVTTTGNLSSGGVTTFSAGKLLQYGPFFPLGTTGGAGIALTSGTTLTVTTAAAHGLVSGNWVVFQNLYETSSTGIQQISGIPFQVTVTGANTFTISWNGTNSNSYYTAIDTSATGNAGFRQILYPCLYEPGISFIWNISTTSGVTTVSTTAPHNFQVGQEIGFRIPSVYGSTELNELPDVSIPGSPIYYYINSVPSSNSFTFLGAPAYTAFTVQNIPFASFVGLQFPQVLAVGDVNTGATLFSGGQLYPSPQLYNGFSTTSAPTINGPAILGAYVNNTSQGFFFGSGAAPIASQVIYWEALYHDISVN
jgi:hypothetical protein